MKTASLPILGLVLLLAAPVGAQVPQLINYQGRVVQGGTNFNGTGSFKFALVNAAGNVTFWSNDGTSAAGSQPTAAISLSVVNGLYAVLLGDATIPNMTVIPSTVFNNADVRLRVWFNGGPGFQLLSPDQRIAAVGYALMAANVPDGAITGAKLAAGAVGATQLADGAVTTAKLAASAVTSVALANTVEFGNPTNANGRLDIYRTPSNTAAISLVGGDNRISTFGDDGQEQIRLWGSSWGEIFLYDSTAANNQVVNLTANNNNGGRLQLYATNGNNTVDIRGEFANASGAAWMTLRDGARENISFAARNGVTGAGGLIDVKNTNAANTVRILGDDGFNRSGQFEMYAGGTNRSFRILANDSAAGSAVYLYDGLGRERIEIDSDDGDDAAIIRLRNENGAATITLDASLSGDGRITTQELQITGGSDFSEQFDIAAVREDVKPGLLVCIDPKHPGKLVTSHRAYDRTVAGVVSGAGGVKPGMLMGQKGTAADGQHPVALTGRVYCWADTANGAIEPGDLITTSDTPGHGMKATDHARAQGAIIGKAMTALGSGKGLVLVLVSLQ